MPSSTDATSPKRSSNVRGLPARLPRNVSRTITSISENLLFDSPAVAPSPVARWTRDGRLCFALSTGPRVDNYQPRKIVDGFIPIAISAVVIACKSDWNLTSGSCEILCLVFTWGCKICWLCTRQQLQIQGVYHPTDDSCAADCIAECLTLALYYLPLCEEFVLDLLFSLSSSAQHVV